MSCLVSRDAIAFLNLHVDHVVKLELVLNVHSSPSSTTTVVAIARELDVSRNQVRSMAQELADHGVVSLSSDRVQLTSSVAERCAIADLAQAYRRDPAIVQDLLRAMGRTA